MDKIVFLYYIYVNYEQYIIIYLIIMHTS